jgi:hypothetical protein
MHAANDRRHELVVPQGVPVESCRQNCGRSVGAQGVAEQLPGLRVLQSARLNLVEQVGDDASPEVVDLEVAP